MFGQYDVKPEFILGQLVMLGVVPPVLVTGAAGFVGSATVLALLDAGLAVIAVDNLSTGRRWMVDERARFLEGSVENASFVRAIIEMHAVGTVVHCAGTGPGPAVMANPLGFYRNNSAVSTSLIESAVACKVPRFVLLSHAAVYAPSVALPAVETANPHPSDAFSSSACITERILCDAGQAHGLDYCIIRYAGAAGADARNRAGRPAGGPVDLLGLVIDRILGEEIVRPAPSGNAAPPASGRRCDCVHVSDLAEGLLAAVSWLHRNPGGREVFNYGSGTGFGVDELVAMVERVGQFRYNPRTATEDIAFAGCPLLDITKAEKLLGWIPRRSQLETMLRDELRWRMRLPPRERARSVPLSEAPDLAAEMETDQSKVYEF